MSRIGRLPVSIPSGVDINVAGQDVTVKGPKGELSLTVTSWPLTLTSTPEGMETGSRPIRDMSSSPYQT